MQIQGFPRARNARRVVTSVEFSLVRNLVSRTSGLEPDVSRGKDEGQRRKDSGVQATDKGEEVSPPQATAAKDVFIG